MVELKNVTQMEIVRAFDVSKESVKRWVKIFRTKGESGFFGTRRGQKRGNILTEEVLNKVQTELNMEKSPKTIGAELKIKPDTIRKAITYGRLTKPNILSNQEQPRELKTKSERSQLDSEAPLEMGCTNTQDRIEAIVKKK
jgi:hypothetical protein